MKRPNLALLLCVIATLISVPRIASAACTGGRIVGVGTLPVLYQQQPIAEFVFLNGGEDFLGSAQIIKENIDVNLMWQPPSYGSNCALLAHISVPGVGVSGERGGFGNPTTPPTFPTDYQFGPDGWSGNAELLSARAGVWQGTLDRRAWLGASTSSLTGLIPFPWVGTLEFRVFDNDISTDWYVAASVPVYVEDMVVIATLPVLFR